MLLGRGVMRVTADVQTTSIAPYQTLASCQSGGCTGFSVRNTVRARQSVLPGQTMFLVLASMVLAYRIFSSIFELRYTLFSLFL